MCMLSSSFVDRFFPNSATIPAASPAKEIPDIVERKKKNSCKYQKNLAFQGAFQHKWLKNLESDFTVM